MKRFWIAALGAAGILVTSPLAMADTITVTPGMSLYTISQEYGVTLSTLEATNPGVNAWNLKVGGQVVVPQWQTASRGFTYTVHWGDTLWGLAQRFGVRVGAIEAANGIGSYVHAGERLYIPTGSWAVTNTTSSSYVPVSYSPTQTSFSSGDIALLARLVEAEAGNQPFAGQAAVVDVILHRMHASGFPHTLSGIVYAPWAFESVANGYIWSITPTAEAYSAVRSALSGYDPVPGALYFYNPTTSTSPWIFNQQVIGQIGQHVFAV